MFLFKFVPLEQSFFSNHPSRHMQFTPSQFDLFNQKIEAKYEHFRVEKKLEPKAGPDFYYGWRNGANDENSMRNCILRHESVLIYLRQKNGFRDEALWTIFPQPKKYLYENKNKPNPYIPDVQVNIFLRYIDKQFLHEVDPLLFPPGAEELSTQAETSEYRIFFYSAYKYNIWEQGRLELTIPSNRRKMTAVAYGVYNDKSLVFRGEVERFGSLLFMDLKNEQPGKENRLKIAAEVNDAVFGHIFRASMITKSSHGSYTAATEAIFVHENEFNGKMADTIVLNIRRYLMLRRNRFEVGLLTDSGFGSHTLKVGVHEKVFPSALETLVGNFRCKCVVNEEVLAAELCILEDYRAFFRCPLDNTDTHAPMNNQVLCAEISRPNPEGRTFVLFKGYMASRQKDKHSPAGIEDLITTIFLPVPDEDDDTLTGAFSCLLKDRNKKITLQSGTIFFERQSN